jgi:predicted nucleotidyltransferase
MDSNANKVSLPAIRDAVQTALAAIQCHVYLYGSRARGDAAPDSDYDVLVVVDDTRVDSTLRRKVQDAVYPLSLANDTVITTQIMEAARYRSERSPFLLNIRREAVAL